MFFTYTASTTSVAPWFNQSWFAAVSTLVATLLGVFITYWLSNKYQKKKEQRDFLRYLISSNNELFKQILLSAEHPDKVDYRRLREAFDDFNTIYFLPVELRSKFIAIFSILKANSDIFQKEKSNILYHLKDIHDIMLKYGVDIFGNE